MKYGCTLFDAIALRYGEHVESFTQLNMLLSLNYLLTIMRSVIWHPSQGEKFDLYCASKHGRWCPVRHRDRIADGGRFEFERAFF